MNRNLDGAVTHWIALMFPVRADPAGVEIGEPKKTDALDWFALDLLPSPLDSKLELHLPS